MDEAAAPEPDLQSTRHSAGMVIADKYRLVRLIGRGGMGEVWVAEHLTLHSFIALKLVERGAASTARFLREAQAAAALRSAHVVQIHDHGTHDGIPFIAMELLDGESLEDRLVREERLSRAKTARVVTHVARAIGKAHEAGIVHRDLKPANVFLVKNDDEEIVKVLDFGIAKTQGVAELASGPGTVTHPGALVGTPHYMSPEQARGTDAVDWRSDLWALAMIAYECLLGVRAFDGDAVGDLIVQICTAPLPIPSKVGPVPSGFDDWFAKATDRDPARRFQSAREMADALRAVLDPDGRPYERSPTPDPDDGDRPRAGRVPREQADTIAENAAAGVPPPALSTHRNAAMAVGHEPLPKRRFPLGSIAVASLVVIGGLVLFVPRERAPSGAAETGAPAASAPHATPSTDSSAPLPAPSGAPTPTAAAVAAAPSASASAAPAVPAESARVAASANVPAASLPPAATAPKRPAKPSSAAFDPLEQRR